VVGTESTASATRLRKRGALAGGVGRPSISYPVGRSGREAEMLPADSSKGRPFRPACRIAEQPFWHDDHEEAACLERKAGKA
jgi:hypothetical protein